MISAYSVHDEIGLKMIPTLQGVPRLLSEYVQSEPRLLSSNLRKCLHTDLIWWNTGSARRAAPKTARHH